MKNNSFWTKFLASIGILLLGFAVGYGMLRKEVTDNSDRSKANTKAIIIIDKGFVEQGVKLEYIIKAVDEIRTDIKNGN